MTLPTPSALSDIHPGDWVDRVAPRAWRPFIRLARLDRPIGIWLALFPCWAALIQASHGFPSLRNLVIFSLGALVMRGAGCTINDIADRDFDGSVARTHLRPLASGQISPAQALVFLAAQLALAALLLFFLSPYARKLALYVVPLVLIYPFCKRFTHWPQVVLGAAFNWGMLVVWAQVSGHLPLGAVLMWAGAAAWQIGYDTVYAYVDREDDQILGLKSTAVLFGDHGKVFIGIFYLLAIMCWAIGGELLDASGSYAVGIAVIALHLAWQTVKLDLSRRSASFRLFISNMLTGLLLACTALVGTA